MRDGLLGDLAIAHDEFDIALHHYAPRTAARSPSDANQRTAHLLGDDQRTLAGLGQDAAAVELDAGVEANIDQDGSRWAVETLAPVPQREVQLITAARARLSNDAAAQAQRRGRDHERDALIDLALALADGHAARNSQTTQAT